MEVLLDQQPGTKAAILDQIEELLIEHEKLFVQAAARFADRYRVYIAQLPGYQAEVASAVEAVLADGYLCQRGVPHDTLAPVIIQCMLPRRLREVYAVVGEAARVSRRPRRHFTRQILECLKKHSARTEVTDCPIGTTVQRADETEPLMEVQVFCRLPTPPVNPADLTGDALAQLPQEDRATVACAALLRLLAENRESAIISNHTRDLVRFAGEVVWKDDAQRLLLVIDCFLRNSPEPTPELEAVSQFPCTSKGLSASTNGHLSPSANSAVPTDLISFTDAAEFIGADRKTVAGWVKEGKLTAYGPEGRSVSLAELESREPIIRKRRPRRTKRPRGC